MVAAVRRVWFRLVNVVRPGRAEDELRREIDAHLACLADDLEARGLDRTAARLAASRRFGGVERTRGLHRDARSFPWLDDARQDVAGAVRQTTRRPAATLLAVSLIGLVVGATTTLFSLVYGVVLRPLPWSEPDRLIRLEERRGGERARVPWTLSNATYLAWQDRHDTVDAIGGWRTLGPSSTLAIGPEAERVPMAALTPSLFPVLRTGPVLGRAFAEPDVAAGAPGVLLLSHGLWTRSFGGRTDVIGQVVRVDGVPHAVIGVMPGGFAFPDHTIQAWVPMPVMPVLGENGVRRVMVFGALARLRTGAAPNQAAGEATAAAQHAPDLAQAALALFGNNGEVTVQAGAARDVQVREERSGLLLLLGALSLLFVTAVASVATLQLARTAERRREMAVRAALGAGVARLARQWVVESVLIGAAATIVGIALAALAHTLLPRWLPAGFPRQTEIVLDAAVMLVAGTAAVLASVVCGIFPAWLGRKDALVEVLAQDALAPAGMSMRLPAARARLVLTAAQVAIASLLLVGTGLLARSVVSQTRVDRGYDPRNLLTARVALPKDLSPARRELLSGVLQSRLTALPGATAAGVGNALPFVAGGGFRGLTIPSPLDSSRTVDIQTAIRVVTPEFQRTIGLRLRAGRLFTTDDRASGRPVVLVNRTFAAQYLGEAPVGRLMALGLGGREQWEVVGLVDDTRQDRGPGSPSATAVAEAPLPELFIALAQFPDPFPDLVVAVRTTGDPAQLAGPLREAVQSSGPGLRADDVMSMDDRVSASVALPRLYASVVAVLALAALAVAGLGLFGVLAYATSQRTREIGVRLALGATRADVVRLVARAALGSLIVGLAAGLAGAAAAGSLLRAHVHGVSPLDPVSFAGAAAAVMVVATVACLVPLRWALRVGPLTALRSL